MKDLYMQCFNQWIILKLSSIVFTDELIVLTK